MRYDHDYDDESWTENEEPATPTETRYFATGLAYGVVLGFAVGMIVGTGM